MCARFTLKSSSDVVGGMFDLDDLPELTPRYNVAPTQDILTIASEGGRRMARMMRWGLIPSWAKDPAIASKLINARCETVAEKPSYRAAFRKRRCLIVADGFYEWTEGVHEEATLFDTGLKPKKTFRQPHWIGMKSGLPFAFAGLWEENHQTLLGPVETCAILTCDPNELLAPMHDRMPVILPREAWDLWMDPAIDAPETLHALMRPYPAEEMTTYLVGTRVNSPRFDDPSLIEPLSA